MRNFTPAEVEDLTGWTAQGVRDLRNKGYVTNFGELQPNGRWVYSLHDLVAFWVASALNRNTTDPFATFLPGVFAVSWSNAGKVVALVRGEAVRELWTAFLHQLAPNKFVTSEGSVVHLASLADLENNPNPNWDLTFHKADLFNWQHFAATVPERLNSLILEA